MARVEIYLEDNPDVPGGCEVKFRFFEGVKPECKSTQIAISFDKFMADNAEWRTDEREDIGIDEPAPRIHTKSPGRLVLPR